MLAADFVEPGFVESTPLLDRFSCQNWLGRTLLLRSTPRLHVPFQYIAKQKSRPQPTESGAPCLGAACRLCLTHALPGISIRLGKCLKRYRRLTAASRNTFDDEALALFCTLWRLVFGRFTFDNRCPVKKEFLGKIGTYPNDALRGL